MSVPPEQFARIAGRVNLELLAQQLVVIVGIGTVGSQIAKELANSGVGRLLLVDGDDLEPTNLIRHVLSKQYVGTNKAEGLALYLADEISSIRPEALPRYVDRSMPDDELDDLLHDASLIVAATDDRETQRRIGRRALALDIPAIFPALYGNRGGEVVVQLDPGHPCFFCWDGFRSDTEQLRGVRALNADALALIQLAVQISIGLLDGTSEYSRLLRPQPGQAQPQLFIENELNRAIRPIQQRPDCPACAVGPASARQAETDGMDQQTASIWLQSFELATQAILPPVAILFAGGFCLALITAFAAAHSFSVYDRTGYVYGRALGFLLEALVISGFSATTASWVAEFLAQRSRPQNEYVAALMARSDYIRTIALAATVPAFFLYLLHGFGPITPPPWWWLIAPISVCIAHVGFLMWDRLNIEPTSGAGYWISGAAITMFFFIAVVGGFPDASAEPRSESESFASTSVPETTTNEQVEREREHARLKDEAAEMEPPDFFQPCSETKPVATAVTAYECSPREISLTAEFFTDKHEAEERLTNRATEIGAVGTESGCPTEMPAVQPFQLREGSESVRGLLLCFIEAGSIHYAWTNTPEDENRFTEAVFPTPHLRAAQQWWESSDEERWRDLPIERYPARYNPCEAVYPEEGGGVEAVSCSPTGIDIRLEFFPKWKKANAYFQDQVNTLTLKLDGSCAESTPAVERFSYVDQEGDQTIGRLLCFVRAGKLVYEWIKPTLRLFGEAEFEAASPQPAQRWWRGSQP